jgi:hypothetical protein
VQRWCPFGTTEEFTQQIQSVCAQGSFPNVGTSMDNLGMEQAAFAVNAFAG